MCCISYLLWFCCDLQRIGELLHEANMLLLVDEAHGAHFRFGKDLPKQAIELGADVAAQSTHKLLGSMTQTSYAAILQYRVEAERIRQAASLLQSTSLINCCWLLWILLACKWLRKGHSG